MMDLRILFEKIEYLPPFPRSVTRVMALMKNGEATSEQLADALKYDQALTTNVLRYCNSSFFALRRTVTNLKDAVVYIGLSELKKIIVRSGARQYFENRNPGYESQDGELWKHVLAVSVLAERLSGLIPGIDGDALYVSALLHDVGKLILSEFVVDVSEEIFTLIEEEQVSFLEAEKRVIGVDHGEIGARVLERWNFPAEIVTAVEKHHKRLEPDDTPMTNIVRLSDNMALLMGYGTSVDGLAYRGFSDICRRYDIEHEALEHVMAESVEEITAIEFDYGISGEV